TQHDWPEQVRADSPCPQEPPEFFRQGTEHHQDREIAVGQDVDQALERRRRMTRRPVAGHQNDQKSPASPEHRPSPPNKGYESPKLLEAARALPTKTPPITTFSQAMGR